MAQVVGGVTAVGDAAAAAGVCTAVGDVMGTGGVTVMSRQRAMSGQLANLRQCCDAMPSYGLLELEHELRTLASALAE